MITYTTVSKTKFFKEDFNVTDTKGRSVGTAGNIHIDASGEYFIASAWPTRDGQTNGKCWLHFVGTLDECEARVSSHIEEKRAAMIKKFEALK